MVWWHGRRLRSDAIRKQSSNKKEDLEEAEALLTEAIDLELSGVEVTPVGAPFASEPGFHHMNLGVISMTNSRAAVHLYRPRAPPQRAARSWQSNDCASCA